MGAYLLILMAWRIWHPSVEFLPKDYLGLGLNTGLVVSIWFICRKTLKEIDRLSGQVEESTLARVSKSVVLVGYLGYLFLYELIFTLRH